MNEISLRKFAPQVAPEGLILYSGDKLPEDLALPTANVISVPASRIADKLGSAKATNIVMLGAMLAETNCLTRESALKVLEAKVKDCALLGNRPPSPRRRLGVRQPSSLCRRSRAGGRLRLLRPRGRVPRPLAPAIDLL